MYETLIKMQNLRTVISYYIGVSLVFLLALSCKEHTVQSNQSHEALRKYFAVDNHYYPLESAISQKQTGEKTATHRIGFRGVNGDSFLIVEYLISGADSLDSGKYQYSYPQSMDNLRKGFFYSVIVKYENQKSYTVLDGLGKEKITNADLDIWKKGNEWFVDLIADFNSKKVFLHYEGKIEESEFKW